MPDALLDDAAGLLFDHSLFNGHPRFFGYITSSPAPIGMLGDFLASAVNQNCGSWKLSPMATEIEAQTVRWIAEFIGFSSADEARRGCWSAAATWRTSCASSRRAPRKRAGTCAKTGIGNGHPRLVMLCVGGDAYVDSKSCRSVRVGNRCDSLDCRRRASADEDVDLRSQSSGSQPRRSAVLVVGTAGSVSTGAWTRCRRLRRSAASSICGSMSTAHTVRSRRRLPERRTTPRAG